MNKLSHTELCAQAMEKIKNMMPKPTRICEYGTATVVHWDDGTYTAVNCSTGATEGNNIYAAYTAALAKKIYGTTSAVHKLVDKHSAEYLDRIAKEERDKKIAAQAEAEKRNHDKKVRAMAKEMKLRSEAQAMVFEEELPNA